MADLETPPAPPPTSRLNVADRLAMYARSMPDSIAVVCPYRRVSRARKSHRGTSGALYETITFAELDRDVTRIAGGLARWGVPEGTRLALLVKPGIEFVTLVFALLRAGMVIVLVDPGMGRRNLIGCLSAADPEGFVAISTAQVVRVAFRSKFQHARWNVTVGRRWFWGGKTLDDLRVAGAQQQYSKAPATSADDPAAIIFTSGSTGPPKGVLYTQEMFDTQVGDIQSTYSIQPEGIDLACFPLFALFNAAMGVTTILPDMDFSRPAAADPQKLLAAANDWHVTQAFASPAVWRVVSGHCRRTNKRIESLRQVFSCRAPVPTDVLRATLACVGKNAKMHTPYGATECLPVSTIEAAEVFGETSANTDKGAGICVGRKFDSIEWRVIRITDDPIATIDEAEELPTAEIGELIVRGPQVSIKYVTTVEANAQSKVADRDGVWHRTGDVGYLDELGRFWYCGRKSHRVETANGPLYTECVEAIFDSHPNVARTALVGRGSRGNQRPVVFFEPNTATKRPEREVAKELHQIGQRFLHTKSIRDFARFDRLPVDVRHNSKILRDDLAKRAQEVELQSSADPTPSN